MNANEFLRKLKGTSFPPVAEAHRHLASDGEDVILGVRMGQVFALAKEFMDMPLDEVEKMLESPIHEMRVGAVSIMDFQARNRKTDEKRRKELFDLYIRRHDRINTWDLVDRSAPYVVGGYLFDKPRRILYKLARSRHMPERRTAIVSTLYFIGKGDVEDAFKLAEKLLYDKEDLIHKGKWMGTPLCRRSGSVNNSWASWINTLHHAARDLAICNGTPRQKAAGPVFEHEEGENRMTTQKTGFTSMDEYIATFPADTQKILKELRVNYQGRCP